MRQPCDTREVPRDQRGLIETSPPDPPAMERHGDDQRILSRRQHLGGNACRHMPRHQLGKARASGVFQARCDMAGHSAIGQRGAGTGPRRRIGKAGTALQCVGLLKLERQTTAGATGIPKKVHFAPACAAKGIHLARYHAGRRRNPHPLVRRNRGSAAAKHSPARLLQPVSPDRSPPPSFPACPTGAAPAQAHS